MSWESKPNYQREKERAEESPATIVGCTHPRGTWQTDPMGLLFWCRKEGCSHICEPWSAGADLSSEQLGLTQINKHEGDRRCFLLAKQMLRGRLLTARLCAGPGWEPGTWTCPGQSLCQETSSTSMRREEIGYLIHQGSF